MLINDRLYSDAIGSGLAAMGRARIDQIQARAKGYDGTAWLLLPN